VIEITPLFDCETNLPAGWGSNEMFFCVSAPPIEWGNQWSNSPVDFFVFAGYPYAFRIASFSEFVTLRGRSAFDTHAWERSISPGAGRGSGTVQKPLDLSMSMFRQCCAGAIPCHREESSLAAKSTHRRAARGIIPTRVTE
jgi:hypothetical protein